MAGRLTKEKRHWPAIGLEHRDGNVQLTASRKRNPTVSEVIAAKYFIPDEGFFIPMKKPKKDDWLAEHKTVGQSFGNFVQGSANYPSRRRNTLYLLPLVFDEEPVPTDVMDNLKQFASIFFGMEVKVMKIKKLKGKVPDRFNDNSNTYQVHAGKILDVMSALVPGDAFCVAGITMCDLYPKDAWNFAFGLAKLSGGCGVYSLARYLSSFGEHPTTKYYPERERGRNSILKRSCKTMCHEIGHMFGLTHCIYFSCIMNGSNHLDESDGRSIFLCPVCLRKLHHACRFDLLERYKQMEKFWSKLEYKEEADWLKRRLAYLSIP